MLSVCCVLYQNIEAQEAKAADTGNNENPGPVNQAVEVVEGKYTNVILYSAVFNRNTLLKQNWLLNLHVVT